MPVIPVDDLLSLRSTPQSSRMFMVVQSALRYDSVTGFDTGDAVWFGTVRTAVTTDSVTSLDVTADAAAAGVTLLDGMSVFISSVGHGFWDRATVRLHGDQTVVGAGGNDVLYVGVASHLGNVGVGDYIVVLDRFDFWTRYPRITEAAGALTWYKDFGIFRDNVGAGVDALLWSQLGANDAARRQASMPSVPVMGPPAVAFIDPSIGSVDIDFDWSDSYAIAPGAAVNAWNSWGETDHVGGTWNDNVENPAAKTYNTISGLRGFRVWLELGTTVQDPIVEFRRGVRFVFTLRRPEEVQSGDPADAAPITDFEVSGISGSFAQGGWSASVRVFASQASEYSILPGALVILFTDDWYGSTHGSVAPDSDTLTDRENILMVGWIADDSVRQDSETGDVTFDVVSVTELMRNRENYPVPIEDDDGADEWYKTPSLTVDRAAHHYLTWHTNLKLVADVYQTGDAREVRAMDFLAGDSYSTINQFIQDRLVARLLCDRFGRLKMDVDQQVLVAGAAATMLTLQDGDWIGEVSLQEILEGPASVMDTGGIHYNAGLAIPYLSHAPGEVSGYVGTPEQRMALALTGQAQLNTLSGRLYAYKNNQYPRLTVPYAGNWRVFDIWPQEYVAVGLTLERHTFDSAYDFFIPRQITFEYDAASGAMFTTVEHEYETDGPDGVTIEIPPELPTITRRPTTSPPVLPPTPGWGGEDSGRRIFATYQGVYVTDNIGAVDPYYYAANNGFSTADDHVAWSIRRDPYHWWTSGGTERTLWAATRTAVWEMEDFPYGTWGQIVTPLDVRTFAGTTHPAQFEFARMDFSIEVEGIFAFAFFYAGGFGKCCVWVILVQNEAIIATNMHCNNYDLTRMWTDTKWGQHSGGQMLYWAYTVPNAVAGGLPAYLRRTPDRGASWSLRDTLTHQRPVYLSIPYVDALNQDKHVYWGGTVATRYTDDASATFSTESWTTDWKLGTGGTQNRIILFVDPIQWSNDRGATWNALPAHGLGNLIASHAVWNGDTLDMVVIGSYTAPTVYYWRQGLGVWLDKSGNLPDYGVTKVYDIQRDSMGAA